MSQAAHLARAARTRILPLAPAVDARSRITIARELRSQS
jgi:hypothetical protein